VPDFGLSNAAVWKGVIAIERPDLSRAERREGGQQVCRVMSARTQAAGARAIYVVLPYEMFKDKFRVEDGQCIYHYAELIGDHLQVLDRATQREFFVHQEEFSPRAN
jgi:hypothetical protein